MGRYNPSAPIIVGQEWVPIREENVIFPPNVSFLERGYSFTLDTPTQLGSARFYLRDWPDGGHTNEFITANVYPRGKAAESGPVQSVIIPVSSVVVSGAATATVAALTNPADTNYALLPAATSNGVACYFDVNSFTMLSGKRIVGFELLYTAKTANASMSDFSSATIWISPGTNTTNIVAIANIDAFTSYGVTTPAYVPNIFAVTLDAINFFSQGNTFTSSSSPQVWPYRYVDLQRFDSSATTNRLGITFYVGGTSTVGVDYLYIGYAALRVYYCEETRLAVGGTFFSNNVNANAGLQYNLGANGIDLVDVNTHATGPVLPAGVYDVTLSTGVGMGDQSHKGNPTIGAYAPMQSLRELYSIPTHLGVQVNVPQQVGDVFTVEQSNILPQISLHATGTGAVIIESHVYGRQAIAQVYGSITATAEIDDANFPAGTYPQVRFYARRFGNTTQPLLLSSTSFVGSTVSITPGDFDELDEIIDGWKEVTLRFTTPPTTPVAGSPPWTWSAASETVGNRWEVLGAYAPAVSGSPITLVPSAQRLGAATYPLSDGVNVNMTWSAPPVSGLTNDSTADGVLLFSQDPPLISGFGSLMTVQPVTGIGEICDGSPSCMVSGIYYNQVYWTALTGIIVTGFGAYELQRSDPYTDWQTIMLATDPTTRVFNDYEARVGVISSYRIRTLNLYDFAGGWSPQTTATVLAPGVATAAGASPTGVLIFTTNEYQDGTGNLAYVETWDKSGPTESFSFPEADTVQLQKMYGKDYFTAFHPEERGGVQFSALMLLKNAAVSSHTLDNVADAIRNLAWADTSYVCVRTEDGDRWFATIVVPDVTLKRSRQLQLVRVEITQTTDTPSPVDPS